MNSNQILNIEEATVRFSVHGGIVKAVDSVSLCINKGEIVAVVGESGCGKTTLARAVLGLQALSGGCITLLGQQIKGVRRDMATRVGMVWQDPYASLNPRWPVWKSIKEAATIQGQVVDSQQIMTEVGLDERFYTRFPHELSGGQRQRVAIGRAIALRPPLIICDEPTSALDLSIRAQILNLLLDIRKAQQCSILYISHDLTTVRFLADKIAVMYMGQIVEFGPTEEIFNNPQHPYTFALLDAAPSLEKLMYLPEPLPGEIPDSRLEIRGCKFASRCSRVTQNCEDNPPNLESEGTRLVRCFHPHAPLVGAGKK